MTNITENKTEKKFNIVDDLFGWMSERENFDLDKMWEHEFTVKNQQGDTVTYGYDSNGFGIKEPGNQSLSFFEALSQSQLINAKAQAQASENLLNAGAWVVEKLKQPPKDMWQEIGVGMAMVSEGAWQTLNLVTNGGMDKWQSFVEKFTGNDKWGQGGQYFKFDQENNTWNEISSFDYILDNRRKVEGVSHLIAPLVQYGTVGIGLYSQLGKIPQFATWGRVILAELGMEFVASTTREEDVNLANLIGSFGYDEKTSNTLRVLYVESLKANDDDEVFERKVKNALANAPVGIAFEGLMGFYRLSRALNNDKNGRKEFADSLGLTIIKDDGLDGVYKVTNKEGDVIASFDKEELANKLVKSLGDEFEVQSFKEGGASVVKPDNINKIDEVTKMRSTTTGEMTVANQKLATKDLEKKLSTDMLKLSDEGAIGKNWYKDSGESILKYVGGDLDKADKFAQLIAIYSPQTNVAVNTQFAIKAWNKFQAGIPIWDGDILKNVTIPEGLNKTQKAKFFKELLSEFGGGKKIKGQKSSGLEVIDMDDGTAIVVRHSDYDNISTKSRDVKAYLVLTKNQSWGGRKTNNFYNNIMKSIDPNAVEGITVDLWMARAFGFYDVNVGQTVKYDFIEKFVKEVADKKGWSVEQVQASIWVATKSRFEAVASKAKAKALTTGAGKLVDNKFVVVDPKKYFDIQYQLAFSEPLDADKLASSALSFADNLDNNLAQVSWESIPGDFTNHLIELRSASNTMKAQYHTSVASLFVDADGQDILAKELGLLSPGDFEAPGFWMDVSNPSTQSQFATAKLKGTTIGEMDVAGKNLLDVYSSARGLILMQDAVGYTRASIIKTKSKANSMYVKIGRQLTAEETVTLGKAINNSDIGLINGPDGIYIVNFTDDLDNKTFIQNIENIVEKNLDADITIKYAQSDGKLLDIGNNGQDYIKTISDQGRLDILETVASLLKKKRSFDEQFAKQNGYTFDGSTYDNILAEIESALKNQDSLTSQNFLAEEYFKKNNITPGVDVAQIKQPNSTVKLTQTENNFLNSLLKDGEIFEYAPSLKIENGNLLMHTDDVAELDKFFDEFTRLEYSSVGGAGANTIPPNIRNGNLLNKILEESSLLKENTSVFKKEKELEKIIQKDLVNDFLKNNSKEDLTKHYTPNKDTIKKDLNTLAMLISHSGGINKKFEKSIKITKLKNGKFNLSYNGKKVGVYNDRFEVDMRVINYRIGAYKTFAMEKFKKNYPQQWEKMKDKEDMEYADFVKYLTGQLGHKLN